MDIQGEVVLRQRVCRGCGAVFWICRHCDRGQRYCSPACRREARIGQRRRANGRHQRSPEGRLDHRDRQRVYRRRRAQRARVTDQGSLSITSSVNMREWDTPSTRLAVQRGPATVFLRRWPESRPGRLLHCILCGRRGRFVEAFPRISLRR
jgi:hypothetical protein